MTEKPMNPQPVMVGTEQVGWACPVCKIIYNASTFGGSPSILEEGSDIWQEAKEHCCRKCTDCGAEMKRQGWTICDKCRQAKDAKKEQELFDKAVKVDPATYEGFVCLPNGETFYDSYQTFLEEDDDLAPEFLWACLPTEFKLNSEAIVSSELEEHYEGAFDQIGDKELQVLQELLDEWAKRQHVVSWHIDHTRVLLVKNTCEKCECALMTREVAEGITLCEDCKPEEA